MTFRSILGKTARATGFVAVGFVILLCGTIAMLYSPWTQRIATDAVNRRFGGSTEGLGMHIGHLGLRFPLSLEIDSLEMSLDGAPMVSAPHLRASVNPFTILMGRVGVGEISLDNASYILGTPDSLMYLRLGAESIVLDGGHITLMPLDIDIDHASLAGANVQMTLRPDTAPPAPPMPPTDMSVRLRHIDVENLAYGMRMMPTIDTLATLIPHGRLENTLVDLRHQRISLGGFSGEGLDARYLVPDSAAIAAAGPYPEESEASASEPWTVTIDSLTMTGAHALYALSGARPLPGLDFNYIEVSDATLGIRHFYNRATTVTIPLHVSATERCGVSLATSGILAIDSVALNLRDFSLGTPGGSHARFDATMGMGDLTTDPNLPLNLTLNASFAPADLADMFPLTAPYFRALRGNEPLQADIAASGTTGNLSLENLRLRLNGCVSLSAHGEVRNMTDPARLDGSIDFNGNIFNVTPLKDAMLDAATARAVAIPPMTLGGHLAMAGGTATGNLRATARNGAVRLDGRWNGAREDYHATLRADSFPLEAFLPEMSLGALTAALEVNGHGYNPFSTNTEVSATADVESLGYDRTTYRNLAASASLRNGQAQVALESSDPSLDFDLDARGNLDTDIYRWTATADIRNIDLQALGLSTESSDLEANLTADAVIGPGSNDIQGHILLRDLSMLQPTGSIAIAGVDLHVETNDSSSTASLTNRDLAAHFFSPRSPSAIMERVDRLSMVLSAGMDSLRLDIDTLQRLLPPLELTVAAGASNLVNDILAPSRMSVGHLDGYLANDSALHLDLNILGLYTGEMSLDSIFVNGRTAGNALTLRGGLLNQPGNLDQWHRVDIDSKIGGNGASLRLSQQNLAGRTGFDIGMALETTPDSTVTLHIAPLDPVIGYQTWQVNQGNFIALDIPDRHIDANLRMEGGRSALELLTEHDAAADSLPDHQEDLLVRLQNIHVQDWIAFNPFAPEIRGDVSADMRLNRAQGMIMGMGEASITGFQYDRQAVADLSTHFNIAADRSGAIRAFADLYVDSVQTVTIRGALNDTTATSPLQLDFSMIRFPLATVNPFLPSGTARLSGMLNGTMDITGTSDHPVMNGWLDFDSTAVKVAMLGSTLRFSEEKIPVVNSLVTLDGFEIAACNDNPLKVDGTVDLADLTDARIDLRMNARNLQLVDSRRASGGADVYGRAFIDLDADVRGAMSLMSVDATVRILPETNVTYVMPPSTSAIVDRAGGDMVKFVNFADTLAVQRADSLARPSSLLFLDAALILDPGNTISVDLTPDGKYKAQVQTNGELSFDMNPMNSGSLSGRINIEKGFVRYGVPPIVSDLLFNFEGTNYITFGGNMMNPGLNIHAVDVVKANVLQNGQNSRMVNFNVSVGVTGSLENMNVAFDVSTVDDITVANELASMSPSQRASQAMNLLLYKTYTGPGSTTDKTMANSLYNFLAGQLNNWAANTIKGVDLSFGIDQYDKTVNGSSSSAMSYSYQVSKSLFNDRFKIVVGGNYTTDANADENFSQNLINDISFEYFLNNTRNMYLRLFRHTGYESILEGEITQTGVGFVYRRKLRRLGDMFLPASLVRRRDQAENERLAGQSRHSEEPQESPTE